MPREATMPWPTWVESAVETHAVHSFSADGQVHMGRLRVFRAAQRRTCDPRRSGASVLNRGQPHSAIVVQAQRLAGLEVRQPRLGQFQRFARPRVAPNPRAPGANGKTAEPADL